MASGNAFSRTSGFPWRMLCGGGLYGAVSDGFGSQYRRRTSGRRPYCWPGRWLPSWQLRPTRPEHSGAAPAPGGSATGLRCHQHRRNDLVHRRAREHRCRADDGFRISRWPSDQWSRRQHLPSDPARCQQEWSYDHWYADLLPSCRFERGESGDDDVGTAVAGSTCQLARDTGIERGPVTASAGAIRESCWRCSSGRLGKEL